MMTILAPAKLNLFLHITGRRLDGYHLLDSLFVFTDFADLITLRASDTLSLTVSGEFSSALSNNPPEENIVYRAAKLLKDRYRIPSGVHIHLEKHIPLGAGLGGGSSDAAAVLKGLNTLWNMHLNEKTLCEIGLSLGADVPVCIIQKSARVRGIGEHINPLYFAFKKTPVLLIAPKQALSTAEVYRTFSRQNRAFSEIIHSDFSFNYADDLIKTVSEYHNDLQDSAISLAPQIEIILKSLSRQSGCFLSRMSGSGSTCFAIFTTKNEACDAQKILMKQYSDAWSTVAQIAW